LTDYLGSILDGYSLREQMTEADIEIILERANKSLKAECIRPGTPLLLEDARRLVEGYVELTTTVV
jgi:hypothetical protein